MCDREGRPISEKNRLKNFPWMRQALCERADAHLNHGQRSAPGIEGNGIDRLAREAINMRQDERCQARRALQGLRQSNRCVFDHHHAAVVRINVAELLARHVCP